MAYELGYRGYRFAVNHSMTGGEGGIGYLISAALALLGLLIAFTFSLAVERYDARRNLVLEEANAIGTTYLRFQLLEEPGKSHISKLMLDYVQARAAFIDAGRDTAKIERADIGTNTSEEQIWRALLPIVAAQPNATINPALLDAANKMFDLASSNDVAVEASLPATIIDVLIVFTLTSAGLIGYASAASGNRHLIPCVTVFVLLAIAISLTIDLDRPRRGSVLVSAKPFERAANLIRAAEAAKMAVER